MHQRWFCCWHSAARSPLHQGNHFVIGITLHDNVGLAGVNGNVVVLLALLVVASFLDFMLKNKD